MKKILGLVLAAMMLFMVLPNAAFADVADLGDAATEEEVRGDGQTGTIRFKGDRLMDEIENKCCVMI